MRIIIDETSVTLIDMKYKIKKEIKTNYKIIIAIFNIIKNIIWNMKLIPWYLSLVVDLYHFDKLLL